MNIKQLIKIECIKNNISLNELARRCNWNPPNFIARLQRDNWMVKDLQYVAQALNCKLYTAFEYNGKNTSSDNMSVLIRMQCVLSGDISNKELAARLGMSPASLSNRLTKNAWRVNDMKKIAAVLDSTFILEFQSIS